MFQSLRRDRGSPDAIAVDIAPLIDVVFILLIFFLVTTTFLNETGIEVKRPEASHGAAIPAASLRLSVTSGGTVYARGGVQELSRVPELVRDFLADEENGAVVVIPDATLPSAALIEVMDAARAGGARDIAVATTEPRGARSTP